MKISTSTCTGCGVCNLVCPIKCIQMEYNEYGFYEPVVDLNKCINCNLCRKRCPQNNNLCINLPMDCYAAWSKEDHDYIYSASGGVATVFAKYQITHNSFFYGCDYTSTGDLFHFSVRTEYDISRIRSSKYSQSSAYLSFTEIEKLLKCGESVLFVGTPCQVSALLHYLKRDYNELITVDLVCHGTPPNRFLKQYISELGLKPPYQKIRFRGEYDQKFTVWKANKIVYQKDKSKDVYFKAFYDNMISYDSCYFCKYAGNKRVADITIGDFWGLGELKTIPRKSSRPSLVMVNTHKGKAYFDKVKNDLIYERRDIQEGIKGNGRLNNPPGKNSKAKFFQILYKMRLFGFTKSVILSEKIINPVDKIGSVYYLIRSLPGRMYRKVKFIINSRR